MTTRRSACVTLGALLALVTAVPSLAQTPPAEKTEAPAQPAEPPAPGPGPQAVQSPNRVVVDANAADPVTEDPNASPWLEGSNRWGAHGILRLDAAHAALRNALVLAYGYQFAYARSLFVTGDTETYHGQQLFVLWTAWDGLELGLGEGLIINGYQGNIYRVSRQSLGRPTLRVKYSFSPAPHVGLGILATGSIPSSFQQSPASLVPRAFAVDATALFTYVWPHWLELSANVGFGYDESAKLYASYLPVDRFAFNITNAHHIAYGVGAMGAVDLGNVVGLAPFLEITGAYYLGLPWRNGPLMASAGVKGYWWSNHLIELSLAADARLLGAPVAGGEFAGVPPWSLHVGASFHLFDTPEAPTTRVPTCETDAQCPQGESCHDHVCTLTYKVVQEVQVIKEVAVETFTISGKVVDVATQRPIPDSVVVIKGFEKAPLQVDYRTGAFQSLPLPVGEGLIEVKASAPNYIAVEQPVPRGKAHQDVPVVFALRRADTPAVGQIQGSLTDRRTGQPIVGGSLFIAALNQKIISDAHGGIAATVRAGRYDLLITAKGYATQRKNVIIHEGDVIILNIDLAPQKRRR